MRDGLQSIAAVPDNCGSPPHVVLDSPSRLLNMILLAGDSLDDVRPLVQELRSFATPARLVVAATPEASPRTSALEEMDGNDIGGLRATVTAAQGVLAVGASRPGPGNAAAVLAESIRCPLVLLLTVAEVEQMNAWTP